MTVLMHALVIILTTMTPPLDNRQANETPCFYVGETPIYSPVLLAPMAGVTDVVFRQLVRRWAPQSLVCTEMISSNGMIYSKQRKARILEHTEVDHPISYQLAANRPEVLVQAAQQVIEDHDPVAIDLNMGCPVKKITGNFEGCALMKEPEHAAMLVKTLADAIDKPVTVKFRLGWDYDSMNYLDFGKRLQDAGAKMVTLHARTRSQGYSPGCKWEAFGELKEALDIPVIANGDINSVEDAEKVINTYGVDGVMVGRGTQGKPWLLGEMHDVLLQQGQLKNYSLPQKLEYALEHAKMMCDYRRPDVGIKEMRKHLAWYLDSFPGVRKYRHALMQVSSIQDIENIFADILSEQASFAVAC